MSKKKSLFLSLAMVLIVGLSIVAGTFAYFQWQAATGTQVNVTIEMGGIKMHIEPEATGFVGLYPTAHCINNVRYGDTLVRIENNTGALAIPSFKLKVLINPSVPDSGKLSYYKEHVHYSVVALETNKDGSKKLVDGEVVTVGGNTIDELVTGTCSAPLNVSNAGDTDDTFKSDYSKNATGLFDVITAENAFADTSFLPREYNSTTGEVQGVTFRGEAYSTSYQWYRVYVWIDEGYTTTIIGDEVTDPLQNAQIQVTWSENSMLQQVSGVSNVEEEPVLAAGLYDNSGNVVKTWQQLLDNGDITVVDNAITDSNRELTGKLTIPEGIIEIGYAAFKDANFTSIEISSSVEKIETMAFEGCKVETITFAKDSKLTEIGGSAFAVTYITSIVIPASVTIIENEAFYESSLKNLTFAENSQLPTIGRLTFARTLLTNINIPKTVTSIGEYSFYECDNLEKISFNGTVEEWNAIEKGEDWNNRVPAIEVICSDGIVILKEPGIYSSSEELMIAWDSLISSGNIVLEDSQIVGSNNLSGTLVIPNEITSISGGSFVSSNITEVRFGKNSQLTLIGTASFSDSNIRKIEIPDGVVEIGSDAFRNSSLETVIISENSQLGSIREYAFRFTKISKIDIPSTVYNIGDGAFEGAPLSTINYRGTMNMWQTIHLGTNWNLDIYTNEIICTDGIIRE